MSNVLEPERAAKLATEAGKAFTPASPVRVVELFAGRLNQIHKVMDAIHQPGLHAVIYGERGVGKTSLANVLGVIADNPNNRVITAKVNCDAGDTFSSVWRKALAEITFVQKVGTAGFTADAIEELKTLGSRLPNGDLAPNDIRAAVGQWTLLFIFDEFDRLPQDHVRVFTDLIKLFSDHALNTKIIVVGVSDTVDDLVKDHASIERALVQIPMPRMTPQELSEILKKGAEKLQMTFSVQASQNIVRISQGLPHFTHLLALHSVRAALKRRFAVVQGEDLDAGLTAAVQDAQQTIKTKYHQAVTSSRKDALFRQVLLACALARKDELSYFQPKDVEAPLSAIMKKYYKIPAFAAHLNKFCDTERGEILERVGQQRRFRYRFTSPLLEPFIIMSGIASNTILSADLAAF